MFRIVALVLLLTTPVMAQRPYCGKIQANLPEYVNPGLQVIGSQDCGSFAVVSNSHVLTNYHNIRDYLAELNRGHKADILLTFADGSTRQGFVIDGDEENDLALIGFQGGLSKGLHRIGVDSEEPTGTVTVGGYPLCGDYKEQTQAKLEKDRRFGNSFRFSGNFQVGFSGSPVINERGYLVGLLWGCDYDPNLPNTPTFGYAVDIHHVRQFLKKNKVLFD